MKPWDMEEVKGNGMTQLMAPKISWGGSQLRWDH